MKALTQIPFKRGLAIAGIALAVPLSAMAFAGHGKGEACGPMGGKHAAGMMHGGGAMHAMRGLHRLDLSEAQEDKIFDLMHAQAPVMRNQMRALRNAEAALQKLKAAPDYSDAKARTLIDQIARQRADMEMARLRNERQVLDVLTPEQRKELAEMKPRKHNGHPRRGEAAPGASS